VLKKLTKDVAIYGGADLLFKLAAFVIVPFYAHLLSVAQFGTMVLLTVSATLLGYAANLGVNNAMHRFYFDPDIAETDQPAVVSTGLAQLVVASVAIAALALLATAGVRDQMLAEYHIEWVWAALVILNIVPDQLAQYTLDAVRLHFAPWHFFVIALVKNLAGILFGLWLLVGWNLGLTGVFLGTIIGTSAAVPLGLWMIRKDLTLRFDRRIAASLFRYGYPFVFVSAAYWVFGSMDRWLLLEMSTPEEVGLFSIAFKFAAVLSFLIGAFAQAWSPYAMKMVREDPNYRRTFASIFSAWYFLLALAGLFVALFAREALVLLTPRAYWPAAPALSVGAAGMVLFGTTQITALGITLEKRTMLLTAGAWFAAIVNVVANFILIPPLGALGSAIATLFAYGALTGSFLLWTQKIHPLPLEHGKLLYSTAIVGIAIAAPFLFPAGEIEPAALAMKSALLLLAIAGALAVQIVPRELTSQLLSRVRG
jgi:O-antigen/teichoic acid export membrane protein